MTVESCLKTGCIHGNEISCKDDFYVSKSTAQPFLVSSRNAPDDTKNGCVADYMSANFLILSDTLPFIKYFSVEKKK